MTKKALWLFADQLGDHFLDENSSDPVILIESRAALRRRTYHRAKAHLVLSALRHRAEELGERAIFITAETYREGLAVALSKAGLSTEDVYVRAPTSYGAREFVESLGVSMTPARGFVSTQEQFAQWADGRKRLILEDFYRQMRRATGVLMDEGQPVGGQWNFDAENRLSPPRKANSLGVAEPWWPVEDDIDAQVRADLDAWEADGSVTTIGVDSPRRFAATRAEARAVLEDFIAHRLDFFGPYEDAVMSADWVMAHSLLSAPMNLGLLDPRAAINAVEDAYREGTARLSSVEGFIRQVMGWRDYVWHLYWHLGPDYVSSSNALAANVALPDWWKSLDGDSVRASCLSHTLTDIKERGWVHHIPRLMILGNWALQQGFDPYETTEWFTEVFVDAYPWVMAANVVGMALYADGGVMATKPYAAGGAYIKRMTNYCSGCEYQPTQRVGDSACPFTSGYWAFLHRQSDRLKGNNRVAQPLRNLQRLADMDEVVAQVQRRGTAAP